MQVLALAENVAADAVAAQVGVALLNTPFLPGRQVVGEISFSGNYAVAGTIKIQSSPDNATWTDQLVAATINAKEGDVATDNYMRANCTAAGTAASKYSVYLFAAAS